MQDGGIVIVDRHIIIFIEHSALDQAVDRVERQIRIDRRRAKSKQRGKMMDLPWLGALKYDR